MLSFSCKAWMRMFKLRCSFFVKLKRMPIDRYSDVFLLVYNKVYNQTQFFFCKIFVPKLLWLNNKTCFQKKNKFQGGGGLFCRFQETWRPGRLRVEYAGLKLKKL